MSVVSRRGEKEGVNDGLGWGRARVYRGRLEAAVYTVEGGLKVV